MFTVWEILLDHFETDHNEKCWEYLERRPPTEKLVEDFAYEFHLCPGISHDELRQLTEHFRANSELAEKLAYAKVFCEADAIRLLEDLAEHREEQVRQFGEQQELIFASRNGEPLFSANLRRPTLNR